MKKKVKIELELEFTTHWDGDAKVEVADIPALGIKTQASFENIGRAAHSAAQNWLQVCLDRGLIAKWKNYRLAASQPGEPGMAQCPKCGSGSDKLRINHNRAGAFVSCSMCNENFWLVTPESMGQFFRTSAPSPQSEPPCCDFLSPERDASESTAQSMSREPLQPVAIRSGSSGVAPSGSAGQESNRYWDIFTADDGGRLLRLCWRKNDAGNFMAMEVAEFCTWNNAAEQKEAEKFALKALNAVEKDHEWLRKRADGEDKHFLAGAASHNGQGWVSAKDSLPDDDSDVYAAIAWTHSPGVRKYIIHDCSYYEGGTGSGQKIFADCEGEEFEAKDVDYWIYKHKLADQLPAPPSEANLPTEEK